MLALVAYWPALFGERVWDDHILVGTNPMFRSPILAFECFQLWLYPFSTSSYFRPLQNLSYIADYWFWAETLMGYHLTNIILHTTAAVLVSALVGTVATTLAPERYERNRCLAAISGLLWLVHPIHHAAVAYVSGRADSLAAIFGISAWLLVERGMRESGATRRSVLFFCALFTTALALFSKEIAVTWITLACVYFAFLRPARHKNERFGPALCAAGVVFLYFLYRQSLPHIGESSSPMVATTFQFRLLQAARALGDYLSIIFVPVNLHMERQLHVPTDSLRAASPWLYYHAKSLIPMAFVGVALAGFLCLRPSKDRVLNLFATVWFFIGFFPISNIFPLNAPVAEHWIYMPSAAVILLAVKAVLDFCERRSGFQVIGLSGAALLLIFLAHQQSKTWITEEAMFRTAVQRGGDTPRARANLARILDARGDLKSAEAVLRAGLLTNPDHAPLGLQLASILRRIGKDDEAATLAERMEAALKKERFRALTPWMFEVRRAETLISEKNLESAGMLLKEGLGRWPYAWDLIRLQVSVYGALNQPYLAVELLEKYVLKNWWHREAVILLAQHLAQVNREYDAIEKYRLAGRLDIHDAKPWEQISAIYVKRGQLAKAIIAQETAVNVEPYSVEQRLRLAALYSAVGKDVDALIAHQKAADLKGKER